MKLSITGETITGQKQLLASPISMDFQSDRNIQCDNIALKFLITQPIADFCKVTALWDNVPFFYGIVDKQCVSHSKQGRFLTLECRSISALMLDNEVKPAIYFQLTEKQIIAQYAIPFGVLGHQFPHSVKQNFLQTKKGDSCWSIITEFCRLAYGKTPYLTSNRYITLNPFTNQTHFFSNHTLQAIPYLSLSQIRIPSKLISKVYMKTATETYSYYYGFEQENPVAQKQQVRRERYYHPTSKISVHAKSEVTRLLQQCNQNAVSVELLVPSFLPFYVGDSVTISDDIFASSKLYIHGIHCVANKNGIQTKLTLKEKTSVIQ